MPGAFNGLRYNAHGVSKGGFGLGAINNILRELKRRNVFKIGVAYIITAWLLIEVSSVVLPTFKAPEWVMQVFTFFLILGFPLALIIAWAFELTPDGIRKTADVSLEQSITPRTGRKLNTLIITALVVALSVSVYLNISGDRVINRGETPAGTMDISVAVLPFHNLSPSDENEFFAAGVHEDILTYLSRIQDLRIVSRTSVLQYADRQVTAATIAEELGITHVVEGSVRRAGNRVRVTAQLIDATTDSHLWAENYDRDLTDIFQIQTEVAQKIATALKGKLTDGDTAQLRVQTTSVAAYDLYITARELMRRAGVNGAKLDEARSVAEQATEIDPDFTDAWILQADIHGDVYWFVHDRSPERLARMKSAIDRAFELNPDSLKARTVLAEYYYRSAYDYTRALEQLETIYQQTPNDSELLYNMGLTLRRLDRWKEANAMFEKASRLAPTDQRIAGEWLITAKDSYDWDYAYRVADELNERFPGDANMAGSRAHMYLWSSGDVERAKQTLANNRDISNFENVWGLYDTAIYAGEYEKAAEIAMTPPRVFDLTTPGSSELWAGSALKLAGLENESTAMLEDAADILRAETAKQYAENYAWPHAYLAMAEALLGNSDEARASCDRAQEILPRDKDAVHGRWIAGYCTRVYGHIGDIDRAVDDIIDLFGRPYGISLAQLKYDPRWKFMAGEPRVAQLIATAEADIR